MNHAKTHAEQTVLSRSNFKITKLITRKRALFVGPCIVSDQPYKLNTVSVNTENISR